jgi:hypothetical protein
MDSMRGLGHRLDRISEVSPRLEQVSREDLQFGDVVLVSTKNSVYTLFALEDGSYLVSGGWFDRKGLSPVRTSISGCTWGGSIIKIDALAACGLCLEFGNRVLTTPIRKVTVVRGTGKN